MTDPLGIDTGSPQLGWVISSAARGVSQSRYQIRVADDARQLGKRPEISCGTQVP